MTSAQFSNANLSNITGGSTTVAPFDTINAIDPNLDTPYTESYSLSVQRELPWGFFAEAAYVGNLGRHLIRQPDINQATFAALAANAALPAAQRVDTNALRHFKGYSAIRMRLSDSTSNYHSMQLFAAKRTGRFRSTFSYTWSKVLTDASGKAETFVKGDSFVIPSGYVGTPSFLKILIRGLILLAALIINVYAQRLRANKP